jgi:hypothetical protein
MRRELGMALVPLLGACLVINAASARPPARPSGAEVVPRLAVSEAKTQIRGVLRDRFGGSYTHGNGRRLEGCERRSRLRVRCRRVSWFAGDTTFQGYVTVWRAAVGSAGDWELDHAYRITQTNEYCVVTGGENCVRVHRDR